MSNKRHSRVRGIAIFIVLLAILITAYQTNKQTGMRAPVDTQTSDNVFRNTTWMHKTKLVVNAKNGAEALKQMNPLIAQVSTDSPIHVKETGSSGTYIFKAPDDKLDAVRAKLGSIGSIASTEVLTDTTLVATSAEIENQRLKSYQTERATLDAIRLRSEMENRRMDTLNQLIVQTIDKIQRLEAAGNTLVYVVIAPVSHGTGTIALAKFAVIRFFTILIGLSLIVLVLYFGTKLLTYLLAMMGIKGFGVGGVLQNYSYKSYSSYTGRYGYGYGGKKDRKVKRIYKDKRTTGEEDASPKE